jgi:hypothetical protein
MAEDLSADSPEVAANYQAGDKAAAESHQQADSNHVQLEPLQPPAVLEGQEGAAAAAMEAAPGTGLQPAAGKAPPSLGRTLKHSLSGINAALRTKRPEAATETFRLSGHTGSLLYMAPEVYSGHDYNHKVRAAPTLLLCVGGAKLQRAYVDGLLTAVAAVVLACGMNSDSASALNSLPATSRQDAATALPACSSQTGSLVVKQSAAANQPTAIVSAVAAQQRFAYACSSRSHKQVVI